MSSPSPFPRTSPEAVGLSSSAILAFVEAAEARGLDLHGFALVRHGRKAAEGWWAPYRPDARHALFSLTKSFTAVGALFAVQEGFLSLDAPVLGFFPKQAPRHPSPWLRDLKVRHLLTMSVGHASEPTAQAVTGRDWVKAVLALPLAEAPGTRFLYNNMASHLVSAVVQQATGRSLEDWLGPRLFAPLGIGAPPWDKDPRRITMGGWGLYLTVDEVARFGQFLLRQGSWEGTRLLDPALVDEATRFHISTGDRPGADGSQGYGYQFWRCRHGAFRADGAFGQMCVVVPEHDLVAVFQSGVQDGQALLDLVWEHLLPVRRGPSGGEALPGRLDALAKAPPEAGCPEEEARERFLSWAGRSWTLAGHPRGWTAAGFSLAGRNSAFWYSDDRGTHRAPFGWGRWEESRNTLWRHDFQKRRTFTNQVSGRWEGPDRLVLTLRFPEQAPVVTLDFRREGEALFLVQNNSVHFGPWDFPAVKGEPCMS